MTPHPIHIAWTDSCYTPGWRDREDVPGLPVIRSVGYPIHEDRDSVTITTSIDPDNDNHMCPITIPKCAIVEIRDCSISRRQKYPKRK